MWAWISCEYRVPYSTASVAVMYCSTVRLKEKTSKSTVFTVHSTSKTTHQYTSFIHQNLTSISKFIYQSITTCCVCVCIMLTFKIYKQASYTLRKTNRTIQNHHVQWNKSTMFNSDVKLSVGKPMAEINILRLSASRLGLCRTGACDDALSGGLRTESGRDAAGHAAAGRPAKPRVVERTDACNDDMYINMQHIQY